MKKLTKITMIIFILYIALGLTSCVTKKKFKESQEIQTTHILDVTDIRVNSSINRLESSVTEKLTKVIDEKTKSFKESTSTNENESSTISGTLPPGEKETSVTIGNTVIKNDGGNVSFEIKNTKQKLQESETLINELTQTINEERNARISLENELNEFKTSQLKVNEELKSKLETKTKETDKKGLSFWLVIILIVSAVLFVAIKYFKVRIPF